MLGSNKCGALINPIQISQSGQDGMAPACTSHGHGVSAPHPSRKQHFTEPPPGPTHRRNWKRPMEPTVLVASGRDPSGNGNEDLTCKSRLTICWTTFRSIMWSNHASHLRAERTPSACRGYADDERLHRRLLSEALARFLAVVQGPPGSCRCAGPGSGESETDVIVVDSAPPQRLFLDIECSMNVSCRPYALATSPVTKTPFIVSRAGRYIVASADTNLEQSRAEMAQHEDMLFAACDALCMPKDHLSPATPIPEAKQDLMDKSSLEWVEVHRQKLVPGTCVVVVVEWESAGHGSSPVLGAEGDPGSRQRRCREAMGGPSMRYTMEAMQYYLLAMQTRIQFELLATGASFAYVVVAEPGGDWNGCLVAVDTEVQKMVYTHCLHWTSTFGGWAWDAGTLGSGRVPTLSRDVVASLLDKLGIGSSGRVEDTLLAPRHDFTVAPQVCAAPIRYLQGACLRHPFATVPLDPGDSDGPREDSGRSMQSPPRKQQKTTHGRVVA